MAVKPPKRVVHANDTVLIIPEASAIDVRAALTNHAHRIRQGLRVLDGVTATRFRNRAKRLEKYAAKFDALLERLARARHHG